MTRLRDIGNPFRWLAGNPVVIVLAVVASTLSYFTGLRAFMQGVCNSIGIYPNWAIELLTFCILLLLIVVAASISGYLIDKHYRRGLRIYGRSVESVLWGDATGERIGEFQRLRSDAKNSMLIMGIGMTFLSKDLRYMKSLLDEDLTIRLLMIDPGIIVSTPSFNPNNNPSVMIESSLFDSYFDRRGYSQDIRTSFKRLVDFILDRKRIENKKGRISLRMYPYFVPINVTMVDESIKNKRGCMLIEWCLPFSDWRMSTRLSRSQDKSFFEVISGNIEELWVKSKTVIDDSYEQQPRD